MKAGYIQFAPAFCDLNATMQRLAPLLAETAEADLVVLPELCNSGYNFPDFETAWNSSETVGESRFVEWLAETAKTQNQFIVSGFNEREGDNLYNSAVLVGPKGYLGTYRKLHLFLNEKDIFQPGNLGLPIFDIGHCRLGMLVCFDWVFPEAWRALALKGADLIAHPANLVLPGACQQTIPAHSRVNRMYAITANRIGAEGDLTFTGNSLIIAHNGDLIYGAGQDSTETRIEKLDIQQARNKQITPRNNLFEDRRPEVYSEME